MGHLRPWDRGLSSARSGVVGALCDAPGMLSVQMLRPLLRAAWGPDTCDPHDLENWRPDNPSRGQCGVTALVIQDLLGGDLILGEVYVGKSKVGHHYWNRLPDGSEVDLTADQFQPEEAVVGGQVKHRPADAPRRYRDQYELLRRRVWAALADHPPPALTFMEGEGPREALHRPQ